MFNSFLLTCFLFFTGISAFTFSNYQVPTYSIRNEHRYKAIINTAGLSATYRSVGCRNCGSYGQVNPTFKYVNTYIETFKPVTGSVLISMDADDDGIATTTQGQTVPSPSASSLLTGIVVSSGVSTIAEGTRVYLHGSCAATWTAASWSGTYGPEKAAMMSGKYVQGVDLNNAEGWGQMYTVYNPGYFFGGSGIQTSNVPTKNSASYDSSVYSTGTPAGDSYIYDPSNLPASADANSPTQNPNQQSNYLLCTTGQVLGAVKENSFPNVEAGHYEQPNSVLRGLRNPAPYTKTSNSP